MNMILYYIENRDHELILYLFVKQILKRYKFWGFRQL